MFNININIIDAASKGKTFFKVKLRDVPNIMEMSQVVKSLGYRLVISRECVICEWKVPFISEENDANKEFINAKDALMMTRRGRELLVKQ